MTVTRDVPPNKGASDWIDELYADVHESAGRLFSGERREHTLQPTALVHEAFLRLSNFRAGWPTPEAFKGAIAVTMRRVLIDHARKRSTALRRSMTQVSLREDLSPCSSGVTPLDLLALDDALSNLARFNERHALVAEYKCFGGMTTKEIAVALGVSERTIEYDWRMARAWLGRTLTGRESAAL